MGIKTKTYNEEWKELILKIKKTADEKGLTSDDIAQKAGFHDSHIRRFFGLKYCPTIKTFLRVSNAVNALPAKLK